MKKRILLTGDDGYTSLGTRLLIHYLKDEFDCFVAGTQTQQSGVGGYISFKEGGTWEEGVIDGVPGIWVSGHPVDAIEVAQAYDPKPFDLVISGINWGANISGSFITSGTMAAALRSLTLGLTGQAIAISLHLSTAHVHPTKTGNEDLSEFLEYPGNAAYRVISLAMQHDYWGAPLLNINLPATQSTKVKFTKFLPDTTQFYVYPLLLDRKNKTFRYPNGYANKPIGNTSFDTEAMRAGYISITPCGRDLLDTRIYTSLQNKEFTL